MNKHQLGTTIIEVIAMVLTLGLLVLIANPWYMWMPPMMVMTLAGLLLLALIVYAVFIVREQARDEREEYHRLMISRMTLLTTSTVLVIGMIVGLFQEQVDPWLAVALAVLIATKTVGSLWLRHCG